MAAVASADGQQWWRGAFPLPLLAAWAVLAIVVVGIVAWLLVAGPPEVAQTTPVAGQVAMPAAPVANEPLTDAPEAAAPGEAMGPGGRPAYR